ncbi:hypothetical protein D9M68_874180 [compost metagenome]
MGVGLFYTRRHLLLQCAMRFGEGIQRGAQAAHLPSAGQGHAVFRVDPMNDADFFAETYGRLRVGRQPDLQ